MADPFTWGAIASGAGAAISAGGTILGADAAAQGAYANQRYTASMIPMTLNRGVFAKQQLDQAANESRAVGQNQAYAASRSAKYVASKARAAAAAGGGNATDTSVANVVGGIERQGEFNKLMSLYEGENKARGHEYQGQNALVDAHNAARGNLYEADSAVYRARLGQRNSLFSAGGTILGAAGSLGTQYAAFDRAGYKPYARY